MAIYATFDSSGFVTGFFHVEPEKQPANSLNLTYMQWNDLQQNQARRRWNGAQIVPYSPPAPLAPAKQTAKADIWRRCTDAEAEALAATLALRSTREQRIFNDASYLDHADPLFAVMFDAVASAFGQDRAAVILAPSA